MNLFDVHLFLEMEGKNRGPFIQNLHNGPVESLALCRPAEIPFLSFLTPLKLLKRYRPIAHAIDIPPLELNIVNGGPSSMNQEDNALSLAANWHFVCGVCAQRRKFLM